MRRRRTSWPGAGTASAATVWVLMFGSMAAAAGPLPEFYGLYAVDGGKLSEIKDVKDVILSVSPDVRFIYFQKTVASFGAPDVGTRRLSWLRNRTELDGNFGGLDGSAPTNARRTVTAVREWGIYTRGAQKDVVALRSKPVTGQPEMIEFVPSEPFAQGAYEIMFDESSEGRFYVGTLPTGDAIERSADCIDIESWGTLSGGAQRLLPCQAAAATGSAPSAGGAVPASATTSPASAASAAAVSGGPAAIVGAWSGRIEGGIGGMVGYAARVEFQAAPDGAVSGVAEYRPPPTVRSELLCRTRLSLVSASEGEYVFQETITEKHQSCPSTGMIRFTTVNGTQLEGQWYRADSPGKIRVKGVLGKGR